jgi:hypothetical protein
LKGGLARFVDYDVVAHWKSVQSVMKVWRRSLRGDDALSLAGSYLGDPGETPDARSVTQKAPNICLLQQSSLEKGRNGQLCRPKLERYHREADSDRFKISKALGVSFANTDCCCIIMLQVAAL